MNEAETMRCNICGKEFDDWDTQQNFIIDFKGQYGSAHDGDNIKCRMCCDCVDKLLDEYILPKCALDPVVDEEW